MNGEATKSRSSSHKVQKKNPKIFIIGAGFSGICAGIKLQSSLGIYDYTIFDENHDVGGTWVTHTYPGCTCDVPSHVYSYSFEQNPNWSTSYAGQPEILGYLKGVALKHDIYSRTRFHHQVKSGAWDESLGKWRVVVHDKMEGKTEELWCDILISGIGGLRIPNVPDVFESFKGPTMHTATWDPNINLEDQVVAVIGSGCSAAQVIPAIEPKVKKLLSFQRHPAWIVTFPLFRIFSLIQYLFLTFPILMNLYRYILYLNAEWKFLAFQSTTSGGKLLRGIGAWMMQTSMKFQIPNDPRKREKLTPNYDMGCKRIIKSNNYLKTLGQEKCDVIRAKITEVKGHSIVTEDGEEHEIDVLILATGYRVQDFFYPMKWYGVNSEDVYNTWTTQGPSHYLGIMGHSVPNLFAMLGPNTAYGHNSVVFSIECQANFIMQVIEELIKMNKRVARVKKDAQARWMQHILGKSKSMVWQGSECGTWYVNHLGQNTTLYPGSTVDYWMKTRKPRFSDIDFY